MNRKQTRKQVLHRLRMRFLLEAARWKNASMEIEQTERGPCAKIGYRLIPLATKRTSKRRMERNKRKKEA